MKLKLALAVGILASASFAATPPPGPRIVPPTYRKVSPKMREILERKRARIEQEGGMVTAPINGKRFVVRHGGATGFDLVELQKSLFQFTLLLNIPMGYEAGPGDGRFSCGEHGCVVDLTDIPGRPVVVGAPDTHWCAVNITDLKADNPSPVVLAQRIAKQVWRAASIALGGMDTMFRPCLMYNIPSLKELDECPIRPSPEALNRMGNGVREIGFGRFRRVSYKKACEEGWASAPTNEIQKAVWEEVHSAKEKGPPNGLKIEPPKK